MLKMMLVSQAPWWCPMCGTCAPRGWGMMMFSMLIWLLVVAVVAVLVWRFAVVRGGLLTPGAAPPREPSAREILEARYARGEIDRETYLRMREDLGGSAQS